MRIAWATGTLRPSNLREASVDRRPLNRLAGAFAQAVAYVALLLAPVAAQEAGVVLKFDRSRLSPPPGSSWLSPLAQAIRDAGYVCPSAQLFTRAGRGAFGEQFRVACVGGSDLVYLVSLGPTDREVAVEPQTKAAFRRTQPIGTR